MLGSGLEGPCYQVETWVGRLCNNISPYSPQPWTAHIPPTSKDSNLLLACMFLHGCPLVPPAWPCAPLCSSHPCPPAHSHMDAALTHPHGCIPPHPDCICAHLHFPTQICLVPPHGFPPLHDCHTFPSHSHGHMATRTDTCPLAQTHAHSHRHMPTRTDTCPLAQTHGCPLVRTHGFPLVRTHGCPPPHHHTFCPHILHGCPSSHLNAHMPTRTDTCPLTRTHAHLH